MGSLPLMTKSSMEWWLRISANTCNSNGHVWKKEERKMDQTFFIFLSPSLRRRKSKYLFRDWRVQDKGERGEEEEGLLVVEAMLFHLVIFLCLLLRQIGIRIGIGESSNDERRGLESGFGMTTTVTIVTTMAGMRG